MIIYTHVTNTTPNAKPSSKKEEVKNEKKNKKQSTKKEIVKAPEIIIDEPIEEQDIEKWIMED